VGSWWPPALAAVLAAALAAAVRLPFVHAPLTADEGGYGEVARLWAGGARLYDQAWVDRPQGLLLVFRAILHVENGSTAAIHVAAAVVGALVVVAVMALAHRTAGRIPAIAAGLLLAAFGSSPLIESFTLSGELLASLPAVLSLVAFVAYLRRGGVVWLVVCGLLTGAAVLLKQSGFDGGLAAVVYLLACRRRAGVVPAAVVVGAAVVPVAVAAISAPSFSDWWYAMVTYRGQGDSIVSGSLSGRLSQFWDTFPTAVRAFAPMILLTAYGWRRSPVLMRIWLGTAALAVVGGGNFHAHYYIQLAPPLAVLAGVGVKRALDRRSGLIAGVAAGLAVWSLAATVPLWFDSPAAQARAVFPNDAHLQHDGDVVRYVRAHTRPGQRIFVMWAAANVYYLADRPPAVRYMWYRNIQAIPGALGEVRRALASTDRPKLVVGEQSPASLDPGGETARLLREHYRLATTIDGVPIYAAR
jgi:4-amino-4-deoxy-L-arabinose transferase-like glycosyltransferase